MSGAALVLQVCGYRRRVSSNESLRLLDSLVALVGRSKLATRLNVPHAILDDWISGQSTMPEGKVEILIGLADQTGGLRGQDGAVERHIQFARFNPADNPRQAHRRRASQVE